MGKAITIIGIPSAFLLHGYVGFIFGSVKANPWWGTVLMPIIFIFSAVVSGIALLMFLYLLRCKARKVAVDMNCLHTIGIFLFFALVLDASIESLDWIHRLYEAEESIDVLVLLAAGKLFYSFVLIQVVLGTLLPFGLLGGVLLLKRTLSAPVSQWCYFVSSLLIMIGIFAMRWNVVVGGQLFSKSLRGFTTYKLELMGQESALMAALLLLLPFGIQWVLMHIFLPMREESPTPG
jgi:Ni/Fe-hydrogenase subunit HybB-like protein